MMLVVKASMCLSPLPFEIIGLKRHRNKLKVGHVAANQFQIVLSQVTSDALSGAHAIADVLKRSGVPNFNAGLISYTGPIFGYKMILATAAAEHENAVLQR